MVRGALEGMLKMKLKEGEWIVYVVGKPVKEFESKNFVEKEEMGCGSAKEREEKYYAWTIVTYYPFW